MAILDRIHATIEGTSFLQAGLQKITKMILPELEASACGIDKPVCAIDVKGFCRNRCNNGISQNMHDATVRHEWTNVFGVTFCGGGTNPSAVECSLPCAFAVTVGSC